MLPRRAIVALYSLFIALFATQPFAFCAPGDLDVTFGGTGIVTTDFGGTWDNGYSVALQNDGKIVVAGASHNGADYDFALVRYNANGSLDTTFNGTGKVITAFGNGDDKASSVTVQNDGRIVVAGSGFDGYKDDFAVARYLTNGNLDTTFNGTGKVTTPVIFNGNAAGRAVAVQADGKILVAGLTYGAFFINGFVLVRYRVDGRLDTTFNGTGTVVTEIGFFGRASSVALQNDGKIVVGGSSGGAGDYFALARYNSDGTLDTTFNGTGKVLTLINNTAASYLPTVAIQVDGKIVMMGSGPNGSSFAAARYNSDGSLDSAFNGTGVVTTRGGTASSGAVQADGKILIAGWASGGPFSDQEPDFAIVRYNTNGTLDTSFGGTGIVKTAITYDSDFGRAVVVQSDGKIIVAGDSSNLGTYTDVAVVRYLGDAPPGTGNAPPILTLPNSPVTAEPTSINGAVVNFNFLVGATDAEDGPLTPMVTPPSGSTFPLGDTTVSVSATDANGNVTTGSFIISVRFQRPAETTVTVSAHSGEAAPGAGTGGLPANAVLKSFGPPAINDFRGFAARVTLSAGSTLLPGIYVQDAFGLGRMAAYKGGTVPGVLSADTTFKNFSEPVLSADGSVAFIATITGGGMSTTNDTGVWTDAFGSGLQLVLREGSQVPGLPTGAKLKAASSISIRNGELLALLTLKLTRGVVTDANDTVLLRMTGAGTATVLLREGRGLAGFGASKIQSFRVLSPAQGSPGHGRWQAEGVVVAKVTLFDGRTLLVKIASDGTVTPLLSTADAATPVSALARWKAFGLPAIGSAGVPLVGGSDGAGFTVAATLQPGVGGVLETDNRALLFSVDGTTWRVIAWEGELAPVPSVTPAGPKYASFLDPLVNDRWDITFLTYPPHAVGVDPGGPVITGSVAFLATLQGQGVDASNETALFSGLTSVPRLIARLGDPVPDERGTATTAVWSKLISFALPSGPGAGPVFLAKTSGGDTNTENNLGLWALDSQRTLRRLLRTGDALTAGGSPITNLKLLNAANGAFGVTRSFNTSGSIALVATFADGTQALLRVDVP